MSQPIKGGEINHVRFTLRAGKLSEFLLTPSTVDGEIDFLRCTMTTERGDLCRRGTTGQPCRSAIEEPFPWVRMAQCEPPAHIGAATTGLEFKPEPPIDLAVTPPPAAWKIAAVFVGTLLAALAIFSTQRGPGCPWRRWMAGAVGRAEFTHGKPSWRWPWWRSPSRAFRSFSAARVLSRLDSRIASSFYERFPTVPGALGGRVENPAGSDVGATFYWHLPASIIQHRAIFENGEFPLWNRYNWCGVALWAQCMSMLGDPLHWPAVVTGGAAWTWDFKFLAAKVLFAFGIGLLVRAIVAEPSFSSCCSRCPRPLSGSSPTVSVTRAFLRFVMRRGFCCRGWKRRARRHGGAPRVGRRCSSSPIGGSSIAAPPRNRWPFCMCLNGVGASWLMLRGAAPEAVSASSGLNSSSWANVLFVLLSAPLWLAFVDALGKATTAYDQPRVCQIQPGLFVGLFDDIFYRQLVPAEFMANPSANFFVLLGTAWSLVRARSLVADRSYFAVLLGAAGCGGDHLRRGLAARPGASAAHPEHLSFRRHLLRRAFHLALCPRRLWGPRMPPPHAPAGMARRLDSGPHLGRHPRLRPSSA